jgi:hypothetical protein
MGLTADITIKTGRILSFVSSLLLVSCNQIEEKLSPARKPDQCERNVSEDEPESLTGSYIVAFRSEPGMSLRRFSSFTAEARAHYTHLDSTFLPEPGVASIQFITSVDLSASIAGEPAGIVAPALVRSPYDLNEERPAALARVDFRSEAEARALLAKWTADGDVWFHEPNYLSRLKTQEPANAFSDYKTKYESLNYWWLKSINVVQAYEAIAARDQSDAVFRTDADILGQKPIVAVLDSGVDYLHPALADRIWENTDVNASSCKDDLHGCDTTKAAKGTLGNGEVWPYDTNGPGESCFGKSPNCSHGTHVAGIIAGNYEWADPELNRRAAGVCPVCQIMIVKIVGKVGKESGILDSSILSAFKYVSLFRREGSAAVRVINASFGKFVRSRSVGLLVRLLKERHGALVVGAAGNEDSMQMEYPAAFKDAIAVSAVDQRLEKVDFSNFGQWVDIAAPGDAILSTVPGAALDTKSGTSMAAPMVSGVAGLLLAQRQNVPFRELRNSLLNAADPAFYGIDKQEGLNYDCYYPKIPGEPIRQPLLGRGLLNARDSINFREVPGQPIVASNTRVKPGCSAMAASQNEKTGAAAGSALMLLMLLLPVAVVYSLQVNRATLRKRRSSPVLFSSNKPS